MLHLLLPLDCKYQEIESIFMFLTLMVKKHQWIRNYWVLHLTMTTLVSICNNQQSLLQNLIPLLKIELNVTLLIQVINKGDKYL